MASYCTPCGFTNYSKKRRLLRDHCDNMRIMDEFVRDGGDEHWLEQRIIEETRNTNFFLGSDSHMDQASDAKDPEKTVREEVRTLKAEKVDAQAMVQAAQGALEGRSVLTNLERARTELEDMRSRSLR